MKKYKYFLIALLGIICAFALSFAVACGSDSSDGGGSDSTIDSTIDGTLDTADGQAIISVDKISSSGLTDTYRITYADQTISTFTVTNGEDGNDGTTLTSITPNYDTDGTTVLSYTVLYSDGSSFTIYNGADGVDGKDGKDGTTLTSITPNYDADGKTVLSYTVTYSDGSVFTLYNGTGG